MYVYLIKVEVVSAYKIISRLWKEEEKCGLSEIQLFKLPILSIAVTKKSGYKDILKQKLAKPVYLLFVFCKVL